MWTLRLALVVKRKKTKPQAYSAQPNCPLKPTWQCIAMLIKPRLHLLSITQMPLVTCMTTYHHVGKVRSPAGGFPSGSGEEKQRPKFKRWRLECAGSLWFPLNITFHWFIKNKLSHIKFITLVIYGEIVDFPGNKLSTFKSMAVKARNPQFKLNTPKASHTISRDRSSQL